MNDLQKCYAAWKNTLRSGKYNQTTGRLRSNGGYCCLGVAETVCFNESFTYYDISEEWSDSQGNTSVLGTAYADKLHLQEPINKDEIERVFDYLNDNRVVAWETLDIYPGYSRMSMLTALNDNGAKFIHIADILDLLGWDKEEVSA